MRRAKGAANKKAALWFRLLLIFLLLAFFYGLVSALLSLPEHSSGLKTVVGGQLQHSGVSHPVTAVLINFRGYDTLLEMAVLLLALIGVWSLVSSACMDLPASGTVLERLTQIYTPMMLLVAGYLLWKGAVAPGGAFQAGAVLGAAGVLLQLSGRKLPDRLLGWPLRLVIIIGLAVFTAVAVTPLFLGSTLLEYPLPYAGALILLIETAASISIGLTLTLLFIGGQPEKAC